LEECRQACVCLPKPCPPPPEPCQFGVDIDSMGCPGCSCFDPCKDVKCEDGEVCQAVPVVCVRAPCLPAYTGVCVASPACNPVLCDLYCEFGFNLDENGCEICSCFEPCKDVTCVDGQVCQAAPVVCIQAPCLPAYSGVCVDPPCPKPLIWNPMEPIGCCREVCGPQPLCPCSNEYEGKCVCPPETPILYEGSCITKEDCPGGGLIIP
jgi:hypothetical protein